MQICSHVNAEFTKKKKKAYVFQISHFICCLQNDSVASLAVNGLTLAFSQRLHKQDLSNFAQ